MRRRPRLSSAPTRTGPVRAHPAPARYLLAGQVLASSETRLKYHIEGLLGEGGFGQFYCGSRATGEARAPAA